MKIIKDIKDLSGKTIKNSHLDYNGLFFTFEDDSIVGFSLEYCDADYSEILLNTCPFQDLRNTAKVKLGLMTQEEKTKIEENTQRQEKEINTKLELETYKRLKEKYG